MLEEAIDPIEGDRAWRSDLYAYGSPVGREIDDEQAIRRRLVRTLRSPVTLER